jgi:hypothetical protein
VLTRTVRGTPLMGTLAMTLNANLALTAGRGLADQHSARQFQPFTTEIRDSIDPELVRTSHGAPRVFSTMTCQQCECPLVWRDFGGTGVVRCASFNDNHPSVWLFGTDRPANARASALGIGDKGPAGASSTPAGAMASMGSATHLRRIRVPERNRGAAAGSERHPLARGTFHADRLTSPAFP